MTSRPPAAASPEPNNARKPQNVWAQRAAVRQPTDVHTEAAGRRNRLLCSGGSRGCCWTFPVCASRIFAAEPSGKQAGSDLVNDAILLKRPADGLKLPLKIKYLEIAFPGGAQSPTLLILSS